MTNKKLDNQHNWGVFCKHLKVGRGLVLSLEVYEIKLQELKVHGGPVKFAQNIIKPMDPIFTQPFIYDDKE